MTFCRETVEQIEEIIVLVEKVPHEKHCRTEYAPQLCSCSKGAAIDALNTLAVK